MEPLFAKVTRNNEDGKIVEFFSKPANVHYEDGYVTKVENGIYTFRYHYSGEEIYVRKAFLRQPVSFYNDRSPLVRRGFIDIDESHDNPNVQLYGLDGEKPIYVGKLILGWLVNG